MEEKASGVKDSLMGARQVYEHHLADQMEQTGVLNFGRKEECVKKKRDNIEPLLIIRKNITVPTFSPTTSLIY
jgi:hypothetical protein